MACLKALSILCIAVALQSIQGVPTEQEDCGSCIDRFQFLQGLVNTELADKSKDIDLLAFCESIPWDVQQICRELVISYGDDFRFAVNSQQMKSLCRMIGECKTTQLDDDKSDDVMMAGEYPMDQIVLDSELNGGICMICKMITSSLQHLLQDHHMQAVVLRILEGACKLMPFFKNRCLNLVKHYGPLAIHFLAGWLSPQTCVHFHLCPKEQYQVPPVQSCKMCEFGMGFIRDTLNDPALDKRIGYAVEDICEIYGLDKATCDEAKSVMVEHIPELIKIIKEEVNLQEICRDSKICKQIQDDFIFEDESEMESVEEDSIGSDDSEDSDILFFE